MVQKKAGEPLATLTFGTRYYLALSLVRLFFAFFFLALLVACAILLWKASSPSSHVPSWVIPPCNVGLAVGGVILGLIMAPSPKPVDYSHIAVIAVDEISELNRSTKNLISRLNSIVTSDELAEASTARLQLLLMQQELTGQAQVQIHEVGRWAQVAPGAPDEIVKGRQTTAAILKKLESEQGNEWDN